MHELAITENILNLAVSHAEQAGANQVTDLYLVIGQLSSVVDDSVQFYWDMICAGTICEGATLHFERIPAQIQCRDCQQTYTIPDGIAPCPHCGGVEVHVIQGEEFRLDSIGVETAVTP